MTRFLLPALVGFFTALLPLRAQTLAKQRCEAYGKGVNLSNWLEGYWQTGWPTPQGYSKSFLVDIQKSGIRSVRLPIYFAGVTDSLPPYAVDTSHALFALVDSVISWADDLDMRVIIDNHHGWPLTDSTWRQSLPRMKSTWGAVARRYAHLDPDRYTFELLNEPSIGISGDSLQLLFLPLIDTVRGYAPGHSIVVSPALAGIGLGYLDFPPMADTNLIYTFHTYDPYPFTHQGFSWSNPYYPPGATFPGTSYDFLLPASWNSAMEWKNTHNLPMFLGEFGVGSYVDPTSRCNWMDTVTRRIHENNLSWFYWDVQYDFSMFRSGVVHKDSIIDCFRESLFLYDDSLNEQFFSVNEQVYPVNTVLLFPNPARDVFSCRFSVSGNVPVSVYDPLGHCVFSGKIGPETTVSVKEWPAGAYFVKTGTGGSTVVKKLWVQH